MEVIMKKLIRQLMLSGILLSGFFLLQGCDGDTSECAGKNDYPVAGMINVGLVNNSDGEVHMWAVSSGSDKPETISPDNKLMVGEVRAVDLKCVWNDETSKNTITVYVGRNGAAFKSGEFKITKDQWENSCMMYVSTFAQSGELKTFSNCN
jgi:hypothetical protein